MAQKPARDLTDVERVAVGVRERLERERSAGAYPDDLSGVELQRPGIQTSPEGSIVEGFDLEEHAARVRFRPELGFSSKPVIGPAITLVKRFILRLQLYTLDDLAQQADAAIRRIETALAVEVATRERLEAEMHTRLSELESRVTHLERRRQAAAPEGNSPITDPDGSNEQS